MRKKGFLTAVVAASVLCASLFVSCGQEEETALRGTFTYSETVTTVVSNAQQTEDTGKQYLYSNMYPQLDANRNVAYNIDQSLKLNRDGSYVYRYSVILKNPYEWGGELAMLSVDVTGTFASADEGGGIYSVMLSDPTGGTQQVYGASIAGGNIYSWSKHTDADLSLDYASLAHKEGYVYDEYVRARVVVVDKRTRSLTDDVFFPQLLNYISNYSEH